MITLSCSGYNVGKEYGKLHVKTRLKNVIQIGNFTNCILTKRILTKRILTKCILTKHIHTKRILTQCILTLNKYYTKTYTNIPGFSLSASSYFSFFSTGAREKIWEHMFSTGIHSVEYMFSDSIRCVSIRFVRMR
jgi:hypothetical protein